MGLTETPEPLRRSRVHLFEELSNVISRAVMEYDLTTADVAGVLECVKHEFLRRMSEECEDEDD